MFEDHDVDLNDDSKKNRRPVNSRPRVPATTQNSKTRKKTVTSYGGAHRRRNKHWSW